MTGLWTADEAGAHCKTPRRPDGVSGKTYRQYVRLYGAPQAVGRDVETGEKLYDPGEVIAWHATRPGQGARTDLKEKS